MINMRKTILMTVLIFVTVLSIVQASEISKGLIIENVNIHPEKATSNSNFTLTADIRNVADREFLAVRLTVQGGFPFSKTSPIYSIYVGTLRSNEAYPLSIDLSVDKNAEAKEYPLNILANYYVYEPSISRSYYITHAETLPSTIMIEKGVDLAIEKTEFPKKLVADAKDLPVYVYLRNDGSKSAREIKSILAAQYPFVPSGKSYYIEEIKPGETREAVFHVDVDSSASSQIYPIDLFMEWKENDVAYSATKSFGMPVERGSSAPNFVNIKLIALIIAVVAATALAQIRRSRKQKK